MVSFLDLSRMLEKPPSKDLDDKPGNQDLGGSSGKEPGVGNGKGQGQLNGNGFGVASSSSSSSRSRSSSISRSGRRVLGGAFATSYKHRRKLEKPSLVVTLGALQNDYKLKRTKIEKNYLQMNEHLT